MSCGIGSIYGGQLWLTGLPASKLLGHPSSHHTALAHPTNDPLAEAVKL